MKRKSKHADTVPIESARSAFYKSKAWKRCREEYIKKVGGLCERCLDAGMAKAGKIVHHKIYLTDENYRDPKIALNFDYLELLCQDCHNAEHHSTRRYRTDRFGRIIIEREE